MNSGLPYCVSHYSEEKKGGETVVLNWQTTPPSVSGWYFLIPKGEKRTTIRFVDELNKIMVVVFDDDYNNVVALSDYAERVSAWLGPLPEPEMPE